MFPRLFYFPMSRLTRPETGTLKDSTIPTVHTLCNPQGKKPAVHE